MGLQPPQRPELENQLASWEYGWTARNLQNCLVNSLTWLTRYELFKCPDPQTPPVVTMTPPYVYSGYIPSALLSPEGMQDPPIVPSILVECHQGEVVLPARPNYVISVRILCSLWDDDPSYTGWMDNQHLTEKIFLWLLKERSLMHRYNLSGRIAWQTIRDARANYYLSVINAMYDLDMPPDASDNVDQWMLEDNHRKQANVLTYQGLLQTIGVVEGAVQATDDFIN